jgi:threonyl-tRNA synthetase
MIAVLIEHTGGKWPFWLNPRQVIVVPLSEANFDYAHEVRQKVHDAGFYTDIADSSKQFNKKIAEAASDGYGMILVVGAKEAEKGTVNVRYNARRQEEMALDDVIAMFKDLVKNHQ